MTLLGKKIDNNLLKQKIDMLDEKEEYCELMKIVYDAFLSNEYVYKNTFENIVFNNYISQINNNDFTIICFDSIIENLPNYISELSQNKNVNKIFILGNHQKEINDKNIFCINISEKINIENLFCDAKNVCCITNFDIINTKEIFYNTPKCFIENTLLSLYNKNVEKGQNQVCKEIINNTQKENFDTIKLVPDYYISLEKIIIIIDSLYSFCNTNFTFNNVICKNDDSIEKNYVKNIINSAFQIIPMQDKNERYSFLYDYVCEKLNEEISKINYCRFSNNQCVWQRHKKNPFSYPTGKINGCCRNNGHDCKHWHEGGKCDISCISCRLFTCKYLQNIGISHALYDFPLLSFFIPRKKRMVVIFNFFKSKDIIIKKMLK